MKLGIRGKLFGISVLLISVVGLASGLYLEHLLRDWIVDGIETDVLTYAQSTRNLLETTDSELTIDEIEPIADRYAESSGARITVIGADGTVLGDSALSTDDVRTIDNHADRPEVRQALSSGRGISQRLSETLDQKMLYVAIPFDNRHGRGVVRASLPLEDVGQNVHRLRIFMITAALLGLVVAIFMSGLASHLVSRNLRTLVSRTEDKLHPSPNFETDPDDSFDVETPTGIDSVEEMADRLESKVDRLADQRDRLEAILESMNEAVIVVDDKRQVDLVNSAAADVLRLVADPTGKALSKLIDDPTLDDLYEEARQGGEPTAELEIDREETVYLDVRAAREPTTDGVVIVMHDVTELRKLERMRRDFVANVSHELRTPVSIMQATAETLKDGALEDPEHAPRFLDSLMRNSARMSELIDDLLDISRLEAGSYDIETESLPLANYVEHTLADVEKRAAEQGLKLHNDVADDLRVEADPKALDQVLLNLVENAVKYTREDGQIWVRAHRDDGSAVVEVHDNGQGIPEADRDRVFERFYRVDQGRSRDEGGTGLGLSIVKHLVGNMGGEVGYRPAKVQGSIFWFRLPLSEE